MSRVWRIIERVAEAVALFALAALVVLPFTQVILRDFFSSPVVGLEEATRWGLIALVFLALPLLAAHDGQIRFAEIVNRLPGRMRRGLERIILLLCGVALMALVVAAVHSILQNTGTRTPTLDIPFWLFSLPFLVGLALMSLGCLWVAVRRAPPPVDGSAPVL